MVFRGNQCVNVCFNRRSLPPKVHSILMVKVVATEACKIHESPFFTEHNLFVMVLHFARNMRADYTNLTKYIYIKNNKIINNCNTVL